MLAGAYIYLSKKKNEVGNFVLKKNSFQFVKVTLRVVGIRLGDHRVLHSSWVICGRMEVKSPLKPLGVLQWRWPLSPWTLENLMIFCWTSSMNPSLALACRETNQKPTFCPRAAPSEPCKISIHLCLTSKSKCRYYIAILDSYHMGIQLIIVTKG